MCVFLHLYVLYVHDVFESACVCEKAAKDSYLVFILR